MDSRSSALPPGPPDIWANPSQAGAAEVAQLAAVLETRSRLPDQVLVNSTLLRVLAPRPGEHLLEVGSGSGVLCRLVAGGLHGAGQVTGVDISAEFVALARQYAAAAGLAGQVTFEPGNGAALPFADQTFDAVFAARLLLHVDNPPVVVREMARVLRPGGRVVLMDWDFDTVAVDHPDRELTRRVLHWRTDHYFGNNWSGRQLVGYLAAAHLQAIEVTPVATVARDENAALTLSLWRAAEVARDGAGITAAEHDAWVGELRRRVAAGTFFASMVYFIAAGYK